MAGATYVCDLSAYDGPDPDGCQLPPPGWWCSREPGHDGPCAARKYRDDPRLGLPNNLDDALDHVAQIERLRAVQRELRAAFARSDLDGGAKAALDHPLYRQAEARLGELHDGLMMLI